MGLFAQFFPIIIFFIVFKLYGLMLATVCAMVTSLLQVIMHKIKTGKYNNMQIISFFSVMILGGIALICKKEIFIKWKPTVIYWSLAIVFFWTHVYGKTSLIQKLNGSAIDLPKKVWNVLSILWIIFFVLMGTLNLYVVYNFDTDTWVNFKLFGTVGLTVLFIILQSIFISNKQLNKDY